ncbi:PLP-dependent aminotransferase family protein [Jeotgalibacillus sp. R-1-5s-1]|uniref:aminotransferase-like domain-containing protein n=1 Tax=Jeotgalibacillus sp. R-1-5s-1 TaxID=2555897 RepID=UPI00106C3AAE|nr:PLP-dependent aminotransferase family protein [Jeotgalibacillus sp. R-1-5s-1]TFE00185.1 PLP-dependent aminotransferase family protein [Jeotgalibacillus sp. R-1-5s-1]
MLKYEIIYNDLLQLIQSGQMPSGSKVPSIRSLKQQYTCSTSTVQTALFKLEEQHLIYAVPKSGFYVVDHEMLPKPADQNIIDFATASPTWHHFPYRDFQHCMNKSIDIYQEDLFQYGTSHGLPSLLKEAQKLLESYQVFAGTNQIFVTSGVQRALSILSVMPFPNGRSRILVEQPGYHLYLGYLEAHSIPVAGIQRTAEGIDLNRLEHMFQQGDIKFFYCMPRFHNPLGTSLSKKQKATILKLAHQYDVYIVEDDYIADFEESTKNDPLYAMDIHDRVIYLKSFSKIMFPGLRIGLTVLPDSMTTSFQRFKRISDIDSSMISQGALELYIKSGMFLRYRDQVKKAYIERALELQKALQKHLPDYRVPSVMAMHTHLTLPKHVNLPSLIRALAEKKVLLEMMDEHYLKDFYQEKLLKINVSKVEKHQIEKGIEMIAEELHLGRHRFV